MLLKVLSSWKTLAVLQLGSTKQTAKSVADAGKFYQMLEDIRTLRYVVAVIQRSDKFYGAMAIEREYIALSMVSKYFLLLFFLWVNK